jgi:Novel STAND NTPase 1
MDRLPLAGTPGDAQMSVAVDEQHQLTQFLSERLLTQPYPGIRPFEEDEWPLFFGRQAIVEQLLERLSAERFVAVIGASGDGKSSLVKAGLFATLKHKHRRLGIPWQTVSMRPAGSPMWSLAEALFRTVEGYDSLPGEPVPVGRVEPYRAALARGPHAIAAVLREHDAPQSGNLLLLVDQFEELFRYDVIGGKAEIINFLNQLADVVEHPPEGFYLALTMRADFLGECARYPRFADLLNRASYLLRRMRRDELSEAIAQPAALFGGSLDADLLETLLREAQGEQDELPLLQHALMWLWTRKTRALRARGSSDDAPVLELADYRDVGGVAGALSQHLNEIYDGLGGPQASPRFRADLQLATERTFQALCNVADDGQVTRRPLRFASLLAESGVPKHDLSAIINAFRGPSRSFLMPPSLPLDDGVVIDVGHEAVIRRWDRLSGAQGWLREEQVDAEIWNQLSFRAQAYDRNRSDLLSSAELLDYAAFWERRKPSAAWTHRYGTRELLANGMGAERRATDIRERAQALLESSRRQHARRRTTAAVAVIVVLFITGLGIYLLLSSWAKQQELRDKAEAQERELIEQRAKLTAAENLQQALVALQNGKVAEARGLIETQRDELVKIQPAATPEPRQPDDIRRYALFLHAGGGRSNTAELVYGVLQKQGYSVSSDSEIDDSGGPGVDYFNDQDKTAAEKVSTLVNSVLPEDLRRLQPRRQKPRNPPGYIGIWLFDKPAMVDTTTWNAGPPKIGWCFQRDRRTFTESRSSNFLVNCYPSQDDCRAIRSGDRGPRTPCVLVNDLGSAPWKPGRGLAPPGRPASWFQFSPDPMGPPFPQLDPDSLK